MNVDLIKAQGILINDAVDAFIACATDASAPLLRTSLLHCEQQIDDRLLEEVRVALFQSNVEEQSVEVDDRSSGGGENVIATLDELWRPLIDRRLSTSRA